MVQKGKFCAGIASFVSRLNSVDLPTFGRPTMPIFRFDDGRPFQEGRMEYVKKKKGMNKVKLTTNQEEYAWGAQSLPLSWTTFMTMQSSAVAGREDEKTLM